MSGVEQLPVADAYPNARRAVAALEGAVCAEAWALERELGNSVQVVADIIGQVAIAGGCDWADEVKTDDFRKYVAGKLGAY